MEATTYDNLSDLQLLALCMWREARGESTDGKRGVGHVIRNRIAQPGWWGRDWRTVILKPWQFSSFNANDPNSKKFPAETDPSWNECMSLASGIYLNVDTPDPTDGAQFYYDTSIGWPKAWGPESEYTNTFNVGRLKFWRHEKPHSNAGAIQDVAADG